jgi:NAD(P)-dependent dehydrogenase (short-subunit alcohol dehydrogenase family)
MLREGRFMPRALITGASTGIGRATALHLAGAGWKVFAGVRSERDSESLRTDGGQGVIPLILDVTDSTQIANVAQLVDDEDGGLDALVNNAGVGFGGPLELISLEDLRSLFEVNVFGHIAVTQALLPALRKARGRIVFTSSIGGRVAMAFTAPYAASKHALEAIGDTLRVELRTSGVQVTLIEPGSVATPIWGKSRADAAQASIPAELQPYYGKVPEAMGKVLESTARRGVPAERVAQTIERALSARRMKARYLVGGDARAMLLAKRLLPDLLFDRLARRALGV